jgi:cytoskeleton protein RodZ
MLPPETTTDDIVKSVPPVLAPPTVPDEIVQQKVLGVSDFERDNHSNSEGDSEQIARTPHVYGEVSLNGRVVIRAVEDSWLEVTESEGEVLFSRVLKTGDSYWAPAQQGISFVTGNAGGLEIIVDGQLTPAIGPAGVVRRGVALDPELLKSGAAWPSAPVNIIRP